MIEALKNSIINAITGQGVSPEAVGAQTAEGGLELESMDFATELMASLDPELTAQPSAMPAQLMQLPPELLKNTLPQTTPETIKPQVFDPAMTRGVEQLFQPKTTEVPAELQQLMSSVGMMLPEGEEQLSAVPTLAGAESEAEVEFSQTLMRTPQVHQAGRSPAIDFAKSEIDPQMMDMEDFVTQKNLVTKKNTQSEAYGMKTVSNPTTQKIAAENGLKSTQVISELEANASAGNPMNSQQFILGMMVEQDVTPKATEVQSPVKVFDMSQVKSGDSNEIMGKISDYIMQAKAAKEPTVNMRVNHENLGMIDITVSKAQGMGQDMVAINIGAHTSEGKNFFQQNSRELFAHLSSGGISVSDFKVETPNQTAKNDFDMNGQQGRQQGQDKNFGSEQNQRRHESDRRQSLWDLLKDKEAA